MTIGKFIAGMFFISLVVVALENMIIPGAETSDEPTAYMVGQALVPVLIPALILLVQRLIWRKSEPHYLIAGGLFILIAGYWLGAAMKNAPPQEVLRERHRLAEIARNSLRITKLELAPVFSPPGCEFYVPFNRTPEILPISATPDWASATRASIAYKRSFLRAECYTYKAITEPTEKEIMHFMGEYLRHEELKEIGTKVERHAQWIEATVTATGTVARGPYTAKIRVLRRKKTLLVLMAGGFSDGFPQPGLLEFLNSARLNQ